MNLTIGSRPQHLEDGDLVAYMDHQMDRARHRWAESHLGICAECSARLQAMQSRAGSISAWLGALDEPAGDERKALAMAAVERARFRSRGTGGWNGGRGVLAAAAMVALLLTVSFGTAPGRAWVGNVMEQLGIRPEPRSTESAPAVDAREPVAARPADSAKAEAEATGESAEVTAAGRARRPGLPPGMSAPVRFNPSGNYVLLQVDSRQRVGAITIWVQDASSAEGQVVAGRTGEVLTPTADGLRLQNATSSRADYTVRIPTRYRFIRVKIGDEPETTIAVSRASQAWLWTVNLAASAAN